MLATLAVKKGSINNGKQLGYALPSGIRRKTCPAGFSRDTHWLLQSLRRGRCQFSLQRGIERLTGYGRVRILLMSQPLNPADGVAAKYFLKDWLGQVQSMHLLAFHGKGLAGREEFPVTRIPGLPFGQLIRDLGVWV